ncbi:glycosyltransferase family 2 protein [Salegentibacter flavus]|uniref:Glycosyltransferase involved in cell wall bisynthesis n=1 Tax=Salegentibacter flavus TaxID=287099 RepID=A0A1I4Y4S7_9FLAO|nr:glycosyltransferase family 2 protein [Salegentibacter flavus]SFN33084.1 Glycosyltransferase involved in cell wall bisynthesis [Salegentibacter flavus]
MISIIIPIYNHAAFLKQRLESIFNQTYQNFEVILLDDTSTDGSVAILREYANHPKVSHFIVNEKNSGSPFKQWKRGMDLAKGEYIWIAESDDYCEVEFLEKVFQCIEMSGKKFGIVYTQSIDVDENGKQLYNRLSYTSNFEPNIWEFDFTLSGKEFVAKYLKTKNVLPNASAVVFKRSLVKDSIFSTKMLNMKMCGDWWFWFQIVQNTNVGFLAQNLNYFRIHSSVTRFHKSTDLKKQRLFEESLIRKELSEMAIFQQMEKKKIYQSWFELHVFTDLLNRNFYRVVIDKRDYLSFVISFIKNKIKAFPV